ncbi:hypothetical protein PHPALM_888 [Phytophthora palmivora]|uniref:Uncharacterized protein n=1 Tax=Phytophthora palmivora TaxID=4796 RepID=A0A2P4YTR6_9STRA|nr:hypothetical protein PHPALM_888 [Phytophthora palmivora]
MNYLLDHEHDHNFAGETCYEPSLAVNPISTLSASIIESNVGYLHVGTDMSSFLVIRVDNTNVSFFWDWIDPAIVDVNLMTSMLHPALATTFPYCFDLLRIYGGEQTNFYQCRGMTMSYRMHHWITGQSFSLSFLVTRFQTLVSSRV